MTTLDLIRNAAQAGSLLPAAAENAEAWLAADFPEWVRCSIGELAGQKSWDELNDRFYRYLEFGTGGMRGRTIGRVVTAAERGPTEAPETGRPPVHAAAGCNVLNDFTLVRATIGLHRHVSAHLRQTGRFDLPRLVIAHDVRHFSRHFCELAASTWTRLGGVAFIFDGPARRRN